MPHKEDSGGRTAVLARRPAHPWAAGVKTTAARTILPEKLGSGSQKRSRFPRQACPEKAGPGEDNAAFFRPGLSVMDIYFTIAYFPAITKQKWKFPPSGAVLSFSALPAGRSRPGGGQTAPPSRAEPTGKLRESAEGSPAAPPSPAKCPGEKGNLRMARSSRRGRFRIPRAAAHFVPARAMHPHKISLPSDEKTCKMPY